MKYIFYIIFYFFIFYKNIYAFEIKQEFLNQFESIAIKTIAKSETLHSKSSQREIYGTKEISNILGEKRTEFNVKIIYLDNNKIIEDISTLIWYNSRPNKRNGDYRLKYKKLKTTLLMKEKDIVLIGKIDNKNIQLIITAKNSEYSKQIVNILNKEDNKPITQETNSIYSDTSNLKEYDDLKIYKNTKTNKIVIFGKITKVKDGDTIVISDLFNVRLYGIDTPEKQQFCEDKNNKQYNCGLRSKQYLEKIASKGNITCVNNGNEKYGRFLFVCKNNKYNINQEMVKNGWALSYFNNEYKIEEEYAKQNKLGIWQGKFERPEIWRKITKKDLKNVF